MSARKVFRAWDLIYSLLNSALSGEEYAQEMSYLTLQSGVYVGTEGAEQQADAWRAQYELRTVDRLVKSKVPLRVWQECARLAREGTRSCTVMAAQAAHHVLQFLVVQKPLHPAVLVSSNSSTISSSMQQLQESGLLEQLPTLLTAAAQMLEAAPVSAHDPASFLAYQLLSILFAIDAVWPQALFSTPIGVACIAPAMRLLVACRQAWDSWGPRSSSGSSGTSSSSAGSSVSSSSSAGSSVSSSSSQEGVDVKLCPLVGGLSYASSWLFDSLHTSSSNALGREAQTAPEIQQQLRLLPSNPHYLKAFALQAAHELLLPLAMQQQQQQQQQVQTASLPEQWLLACKLARKAPPQVTAVLGHLHCSRELALWQALTSTNVPDVSPAAWCIRSVCRLLQTDVQLRLLSGEQGLLQPPTAPQQPQPLQASARLSQQPPADKQQLESQSLLMLRLRLTAALLRWVAYMSYLRSNNPLEKETGLLSAYFVGCIGCDACEDYGRQQQQEYGAPQHKLLSRLLLPPELLHQLQQHLTVLATTVLQLWRLELAELAADSNTSSSSAGDSSNSSSSSSRSGRVPAGPLLSSSILDFVAGMAGALAEAAVTRAVQSAQPGSGSAAAGSSAAEAAVTRAIQSAQSGSGAAAAGSSTAEADRAGVGCLCRFSEDLLRADAQAYTQLGSSTSSGSSTGAGAASKRLCRWLLCAVLPPYGPHLPPPLAVAAAVEGAGTELLGLLSSMLKVAQAVLLEDTADTRWVLTGLFLGQGICVATCRAAAYMLTQTHDTAAPAPTVVAAGQPAAAVVAAAATAAAAMSAQQDAAAAAAATAVLPWLVLLGRCCLLAVLPPGDGCGDLESVRQHMGWMFARGGSSTPVLADLIECVMQLVAGPHAAQLSGLGYNMQLLRQEAWELDVAAGEYLAADAGGRVAALQRVSTQLKALGQSLCAFAVPDMCNNPRCRNVCGPSEAVLVGGRSCLCGGCRVACYCSRLCQKQNWKGQHKPVCEALAAAAAAAAGGGSGCVESVVGSAAS